MNTETITGRRYGASWDPIPAVLLVGGMGTRLQSLLPSTPKPLAPVGELPFLELLVLQLRAQGIRHMVMCTGHRAKQVEQEFGDGKKWSVTIEYSREARPLGTAGALKLAESFLRSTSDFLVMNGDSFLEFHYPELLRFHRRHGGVATIAVRSVPNASRYGAVQFDADYRVTGFCEKKSSRAPGMVNGGVYLFRRDVLKYLPNGPASLETDVFPNLLDHGVYAAEQKGIFIDIGTPDDYARAQSLSQSLWRAALSDRSCEVPSGHSERS